MLLLIHITITNNKVAMILLNILNLLLLIHLDAIVFITVINAQYHAVVHIADVRPTGMVVAKYHTLAI